MLDQKIFGEKLRNHRKRLGMTQEEVAQMLCVSPQAISKWEAGDCLPDCFNLKAISDVYRVSTDVLLETESDGDIEAVASKIEQLGTEFIWATANTERYSSNYSYQLGEDLLKMWKGIYFAETGNQKIQEESKRGGNLRIIRPFGTKIWDDEGIACVVKSSLIKSLSPSDSATVELMNALCSEDGQKLILSLSCDHPIPKQEITDKAGIELSRLNELLLLFTENKIIEFVSDNRSSKTGYIISGHCGIVAYMILAAMYILGKGSYTVNLFLPNE
jgi:xre family toxin-antitoxin system